MTNSTEEIVLKQISVTLYITRAGVVFYKLNKPNDAIGDANVAFERKVEQAKALELENKRLCDENASRKAQVDELRKRLAEEKEEQYAVGEKERKEYMDKGGFNTTEPGQSCEAKNTSFSSEDDDEIVESNDDLDKRLGDENASLKAQVDEIGKRLAEEEEKKEHYDDEIVESNVELDNTDVVEPNNDPPQKMGDPSVEVTEERQDAAQSEKLKAVDAISEGKLDEAIDYLTKAIMLNPYSAILYETRASVFVKLNNPNAAIHDADAAFEINPDSAKGYKIRGIANAMLGCWEEAAEDLHIASILDDDEEIRSVLKKVELNLQKIEEHRMKYERVEKSIKISFKIYDMRRQKSEQRRQKSEQDREALSAFNDGQVIGIHSTTELETKLNAATKTSRLAILYFTAKWCRPSVKMSPLYTSLAAKYPEVVFLKVDIDEVEDVDDDFDISGVPTFIFIRNWKVVDEVIGADEGALKGKTAHLADIQSFFDKM